MFDHCSCPLNFANIHYYCFLGENRDICGRYLSPFNLDTQSFEALSARDLGTNIVLSSRDLGTNFVLSRMAQRASLSFPSLLVELAELAVSWTRRHHWSLQTSRLLFSCPLCSLLTCTKYVKHKGEKSTFVQYNLAHGMEQHMAPRVHQNTALLTQSGFWLKK